MKLYFLTLIMLLFFYPAFCQSPERDKLDKATDSIRLEGQLLFQSEAASWYGTDIFVEKFPAKKLRSKGFLSYDTGKGMNNIFFSKDETPVALVTMSFGYNPNPSNCVIDSTERKLTSQELSLYKIRQTVVKEMETNKDSLYRFYKNASLNPIPLIDKKGKRVYVLTGPHNNGVVLFGNDYLINFDNHDNIVSRKRIHRNLIPVNFSKQDSSITSVHSHLPETGDLISATDICTLMLYERFTNWRQSYVVSKNDVSIWDCKKNTLLILTMEAWKKIMEDQKSRHN